jgi:hypothetical protein
LRYVECDTVAFMIVTFTDFGTEGPYLGQMRAAIIEEAPAVQIVDLMSDAPAFDIRAAAYLLPAVLEPLPKRIVCLAVVDPGVGGDRKPIVLRADERWYVGPDNGLFEMVARRSESLPEWWEITYIPERLSASFHGRDLFAPVAAKIDNDGENALQEVATPMVPVRARDADWPDDLPEVIYIDRYGNCMLGIRRRMLTPDYGIELPSGRIESARTFSDMPAGTPFCYENAMGLVEIAVSSGNAAQKLGLRIGSQVTVRKLSG